MPAKKDMTGQRIGRLVCLDNGLPKVLCLCDCGTEKLIGRTGLINKVINSCGCIVKTANNRSPLILGVGINDADYQTHANGIICPYFKVWKSMISRAKCAKTKQRQPAYEGASISNEWLTFSNFKSWMEKQDWEGKDLDKDLLGDDKMYSEQTCMFIPRYVNSFLTTLCDKDKGISNNRCSTRRLFEVRVTYYRISNVVRKTFCTKEEALNFKKTILLNNIEYLRQIHGQVIANLLLLKFNRVYGGVEHGNFGGN